MDEPASFFFILLWVISFSGTVKATENQSLLREKILKDYDKSLPPIVFARSYHYSFISLSVLRIRGLDETKGELIVEGAMALVWNDERLGLENDDIVMRYSSNDIWVPHLDVLNRVEEEELTVDTNPIVYRKIVWWIPRYVLRTSCVPNLKYYPFDKQTCYIQILSITDEGDLVQTNFSAPSPEVAVSALVSSNYMVNNSQWNLLSVVASMETMVVYEANNTVGIFTFKLQRCMPLIALAILTPSVVSTILLLTTFWMRAGATVRTGLCATSIIVSASSLFAIGRLLPVTGVNTPIIVEYVATSIILSTISALQSMLMSALSRCKIQPPIPYGIIVEKLPRWTLVFLALSPQEEEGEVLDETFLFSELSENDERNLQEQDISRKENTLSETKAEQLWDKHILLWDRLVFYLMGIIIFLLVVSIIFTE